MGIFTRGITYIGASVRRLEAIEDRVQYQRLQDIIHSSFGKEWVILVIAMMLSGASKGRRPARRVSAADQVETMLILSADDFPVVKQVR